MLALCLALAQCSWLMTEFECWSQAQSRLAWLVGKVLGEFCQTRASNAAGNGDSAMHVRLASGNEFWALYAAAPKSRYDALKCAFLCNIVVISRFTNEAFYSIAGCTEGVLCYHLLSNKEQLKFMWRPDSWSWCLWGLSSRFVHRSSCIFLFSASKNQRFAAGLAPWRSLS